MIINSSLLYYKNIQGKFGFSITLDDSTIYIVSKLGEPLTFTIENESVITKCIFTILKDESANSLFIRPSITKKGSNVNRFPYPYSDTTKTVNNVRFYVESGRSIIADGRATDGDAVFNVIGNNNQITLEPGEYRLYIASKNDQHYDAFFNGRFYNALYMLNEENDGLIFQKFHRPNEYILYNSYWNNYYGDYPIAHIIYPKDKYVVNSGCNLVNSIVRFAGYTKNYLIYANAPLYGVTHAGYRLGSKSGRKWLNYSQDGPLLATVAYSRRDDTGIVHCYFTDDRWKGYEPGKFYLMDIQDGGKIEWTKSPVQMPDNSTILHATNGRVYYIKPKQGLGRPIFAIDSHGNGYQTSLEYSDDVENGMTSFGFGDDTIDIISGSYKRDRNLRYLILSKDGFKNDIQHIDFSSLPKYGTYFQIYKFDNRFKIRVQRLTTSVPQQVVYDVYDFGDSYANSPRVIYNCCKPVEVPIVGWKCRDYLQWLPDRKAPIGSPSGDFRGTLYFKDDEFVEPYNFRLASWQYYTNVWLLAVIEGDGTEDPKYSFAYDCTTTDYLDPHNASWILPW